MQPQVIEREHLGRDRDALLAQVLESALVVLVCLGSQAPLLLLVGTRRDKQ